MLRYTGFIMIALLCGATAQGQLKKYVFPNQKMGSPFTIIMVADDSVRAGQLAGECFGLVDSLNRIFSDYDPGSELSLVNNTAGTSTEQPLSPALWQLMLLSEQAWRKSHGAFDISVGPLSMVWRKARKTRQFPTAGEIASAKKATGFDAIRLDKTKHTVLLTKKGMRLDPGGIAKGYIAQLVLDRLTMRGIRSALVDAGGDMAMSGAPPGSAGWTIGVNVPETTDELLSKKLLLQNIAVATSGDIYQYIEHGDKKYSHIIDPRTGYGITTQRNVTVIAGNGAEADWLATACSILPVAQARKLAEACHAELLINERKAGKLATHTTKGFARYWKNTRPGN
ncbi:FAD:protein FMN transferase [Sediminibacterium soli]|uniref:FAD:protein FMN transferase n=1 Tax=Sediminibacterium soli TaxID=2698829 RepID=UPI001379DB45|nr:FAD:protein FMN transferase [Sediminibacterium soli]NCI46830.1 FAD:protein FMN transferase [Sediminibacterium soli]